MTVLEGHSLARPIQQEKERAEPSIEMLIATYSALLFRVAHAVLRNHAEAEDAVQETFLRVLHHRAALPQVQDMRVWLVRILWNVALDRRRKLKPQQQMDDTLVAALLSRDLPADTRLMQASTVQRVLDELDRLPERERQVLLLSAMEEMPIADIAAVLRRSSSAVRALLFRARSRLIERMERKETRR